MRLLRSELAFPGRLEKAESGVQGLIDRVDPVTLVSARRSDPYWLPWRFETPPGGSDEPPGSVEPLRVALPLLSPCLAKVFCQTWTKERTQMQKWQK